MDVAALAKFSAFDERIDIAGKLVRDKDGDAAYNFGKEKGVKVRDNLNFASWILRSDFPVDTKNHLRRIQNEIVEELSKAPTVEDREIF